MKGRQRCDQSTSMHLRHSDSFYCSMCPYSRAPARRRVDTARTRHHNTQSEQDPRQGVHRRPDLGGGLHFFSPAWQQPGSLVLHFPASRRRNSLVARTPLRPRLVAGHGGTTPPCGIQVDAFLSAACRWRSIYQRSLRYFPPSPHRNAQEVVPLFNTLVALHQAKTV